MSWITDESLTLDIWEVKFVMNLFGRLFFGLALFNGSIHSVFFSEIFVDTSTSPLLAFLSYRTQIWSETYQRKTPPFEYDIVWPWNDGGQNTWKFSETFSPAKNRIQGVTTSAHRLRSISKCFFNCSTDANLKWNWPICSLKGWPFHWDPCCHLGKSIIYMYMMYIHNIIIWQCHFFMSALRTYMLYSFVRAGLRARIM